jgi:hypothetical protein
MAMNKFLRKCAIVLSIIITINLLSFGMLLLFSPAFKKAHESSAFKNQDFDLLVFGNSMALDGIDTEYLTQNGINSYDFAVAGGHISTALIQLEEYLKYNKKPRIVLIGFSSATGGSLMNKVPHTNPEIEFFYHPTLKENVLNPAPVNFRWLFVEMLKIVVSKDHRNSEIIRGQWRSPKTIPDTTVFQGKNSPIDYKDPYLAKLVSLCQKRGIRLILAELPGANKNRDKLPFKYATAVSDSQQAMIYNFNNYDVSSKIINPATDFLAPDHLNEKGAKKITVYLLENILKGDTID